MDCCRQTWACYPSLNERFGAGGLTYLRLGDVTPSVRALADVFRIRPASAGEVLTRVSSLLSETVPRQPSSTR